MYKFSLGDFGSFEELLVEKDNNEILTGVGSFFVWLLFLIGTLFIMVVMLNLLISIIGDSYDKAIENKESA